MKNEYRFKRGEEMRREGGYILYKVHYDDGKLHLHVHERVAQNPATEFKQKINMLLHERVVEEGIMDWYAGGGSSEAAQLIWNTKEIPLNLTWRNFSEGGRIAKGTPLQLFEITMKGDNHCIDSNIAVASGKVNLDAMLEIKENSRKINDVVKSTFSKVGLTLVKIDLAFGLDDWSQVRLTSELSESTCILWNKSGKEVQDAVFGMDLNVEEVANIYEKIK